MQNSVGSVPYAQIIFVRLDVDICSTGGNGIGKDLIDQLHHGSFACLAFIQ